MVYFLHISAVKSRTCRGRGRFFYFKRKDVATKGLPAGWQTPLTKWFWMIWPMGRKGTPCDRGGNQN